MATVFVPDRQCHKGIRRHGDLTPYIMDDDGNYLEGVNAFIWDRVKGRINPSDISAVRVKLKKLSSKTAMSIAQRLCDATNFLESEAAHPKLGKLSWETASSTTFTELYSDAMERGYWSLSFWERGRVTPLNMPNTIKPRVDEATLCGAWQEHKGYISGFSDGSRDGDISALILDAVNSYEAIRIGLGPSSLPDRVPRQNPTDGLPPPIEEIVEFISMLPTPTLRAAAFALFETGMRGEELAQNLRVPPSWFGRGNARGEPKPGFLPELDVVWDDSPANLKNCKWRAYGKGNKVRFIRITPDGLKVFWKYFTTYRTKVLSKTKSQKPKATDELFVNRDGGPLSYHNLASAMRSVNLKLKRSYRITQHILRHAHACTYLEEGLVADLEVAGIDIANATYEQFMKYGEGVLLSLKVDLGHEFLETTHRYLQLLAHGKIALRYQIAFNKKIDALGGIRQAFTGGQKDGASTH